MDSVANTSGPSSVDLEKIAQLEQAFELFNETSMQLSESYEALQAQVEHLQEKLEKEQRDKHQLDDRLSQLLNLLPAGVIVLDAKHTIIELNPSASDILGSDALGRNWDIVVMNVFLRKTKADELITHDDRIFQLSRTALENQIGSILLIQDVTSARQLQEHINRHQRLSSMGEMAASLAHQVRTPLASALLYVSQLNSAEIDASHREKFVNKAMSSLQHLEGLISDMLQYAKGGKRCENVVVLSELMQALAKSVEPVMQRTGGKVFIEPNHLDIKVLGDIDALQTALQNLVNNAAELIGKEALIQISVKPMGRYIDVIVSDNGPGIDAERLEKVFEPFYTSRARGTGLGLAVVRAVAEAHNGEAWVKSIIGYGSKFGLRIPVYESRGGS